ncbi:AtpZ/AtpI family protein [Tepidibacillus sp. LV47]|uniref:AtpZ/AtpI family protein n=1 Tax=Tepidibacillus sp. LV47 TaxID=3398228 RepID=UPI003AADE8F5
MDQDRGRNNRNPWRALAVVGVVGTNLAIFLLIGIWFGKKMDTYFHSSPIFLIAGMVVGFTLGVWSVVGLIKPFLGD